jgi:hypothetical protein
MQQQMQQQQSGLPPHLQQQSAPQQSMQQSGAPNTQQHVQGISGPPVPLMQAPPTPKEAKKSKPRARKPTMTSEAGGVPPPDAPLPTSQAPGAALNPQAPDAASQQQGQPGSQGTAQFQAAQAAMRALQSGTLNRQQQEAAYAAVRAGTAGLQPGAQAPQPAQGAPQSVPPSGTSAPVPPPTMAVAMQQQQQQQQAAAAAGAPLAPGLGAAAAQALAGLPGQGQASVAPPPPSKFKIEYMPIRRDLKSHGGWDLEQVDEVLGPTLEGRGRLPRTVRELGLIDVLGLTMSLRSRLETEVAYALNALCIISAGSGAPPNIEYTFPLAPCEDLLDELLELLEESAFGRDEDALDATLTSERVPADGEADVTAPENLTHRDWVLAALEDEENPQPLRRRRRRALSMPETDENGAGPSRKRRAVSRLRATADSDPGASASTPPASPPARAAKADDDEVEELSGPKHWASLRQERFAERSAALALTVLDIVRNFSVMPDNVELLAQHPRALRLLARLCVATERETREMLHLRGALKEPEAELDDASRSSAADEDERTVFTPAEALRVRKDVLAMLSHIAGPHLRLSKLGRSATMALFDLLTAFIIDAGDMEHTSGRVWSTDIGGPPPQPGQRPQLLNRKVPQHADSALDAFSRFAQPDENREVLSAIVPAAKLLRLGTCLTRLLPVSELDFYIIKTEGRLAYHERAAMSLYNIAFLAPPRIKAALRDAPGVPGVLYRCVRKLLKVHANFEANPFSCLVTRLAETLRLLSDGNDTFATLNGRHTATAPGILVDELMGVLDIFATDNIDPGLVAELEVTVSTT